jgi:hypothetical protein
MTMNPNNWKWIALLLVALLAIAGYHLSQTSAELISVQAELKGAQSQLLAVQKVYPAKNFPDSTTLKNWVTSQPLPAPSSDAQLWYQSALELQRKAAKDGYLISASLEPASEEGYYRVFCYAVLDDGSLWYWDSETYNLYYWLDIKRF